MTRVYAQVASAHGSLGLSRPLRAKATPRVFVFQAEDGIRDYKVTGVQTCALPISELVEMAGGVNLLGERDKHSGYLSWEKIAASDPDVIIVCPCGFDMARTESEMYWLTKRPDWRTMRAVRDGRVFRADGNQYFNRPGPRLVE